MKYLIALIVLIVIFLVGCSTQNQTVSTTEQKEEAPPSAESIIAEMINKEQASTCEEITELEDKQVCYSTYMALKAEKEESFDASICDKVKPENKEGCNLYLAILKTNG